MAQQIKKKFIGPDQVDGEKILLQSGQVIRATDSLGDPVSLIGLVGNKAVLRNAAGILEEPAFKSQLDAVIDDLDFHTGAQTGAHDASAIAIDAIAGVTGADVQGALENLKSQIDSLGTASQEDIDDLISLSGVAANSVNLGSFTGVTIPDNQTVKAALQALETAHEEVDVNVNDLISLSGVAENSTNLGTFTGDIIADSSTIKSALQAIETELVDTRDNVDDLITLSGVAENAEDLGTFTGSTIQDSRKIKEALQDLETAHEAHLNDASDAHDASAISVSAIANLDATDVQAALAEIQGDLDALSFAAADISFVAGGDIVATNVQDAIEELDTEKVAKAGDTMTGQLIIDQVTGQPAILVENSVGATLDQVAISQGNVIVDYADAVASKYADISAGSFSAVYVDSTVNSSLTVAADPNVNANFLSAVRTDPSNNNSNSVSIAPSSVTVSFDGDITDPTSTTTSGSISSTALSISISNPLNLAEQRSIVANGTTGIIEVYRNNGSGQEKGIIADAVAGKVQVYVDNGAGPEAVTPTLSYDLTPKKYVDDQNALQDTAISGKVSKAGDILTGTLEWSDTVIDNSGAPYVFTEVTTTKIGEVAGGSGGSKDALRVNYSYSDTDGFTEDTRLEVTSLGHIYLYSENSDSAFETQLVMNSNGFLYNKNDGSGSVPGDISFNSQLVHKKYVDDQNALQDTALTNHLNDAVDAHDASAISFSNTLSGLAATTAQAAIDELAAEKLNLSGGTMSGNILMGNNSITNVLMTSDPHSVATRQYVDTVAEGLHVHAPARLLASVDLGGTYNNGVDGIGAHIDFSSPIASIDGVTSFSVGDRIILAFQNGNALDAENGIYFIEDAADIDVNGDILKLTRAVDFNSPSEMAGGDFVFVQEGSQYADTGWVMTETVVTVGTTPVKFLQFSGAGSYTAGDGLDLNGTIFSVNVSEIAGSGLEDDGSNNLRLTDTTVTAASYGTTAAKTASFTVDAKGRLTAASEQDISILATQVSDFQSAVRAEVSAGDGLDYNSTTGEFSVDLKSAGGLKIDATELAVEVADFAGNGLEDDGSDNLRIKQEFVTVPDISVSSSGLSIVNRFAKETYLIQAADTVIVSDYYDLDHEIEANSLIAFVDRLAIHETVDYTISVVGGVTRVTFIGDLIAPGQSQLSIGDRLSFTYQKKAKA
jgi:NifU-like protein involved in Fe-S cluster formation